jgi:acyl carrier protein
MSGIGSKLVDIVVQQLSVDREKVVPNANFIDDLGADSLDIVELIMTLEEKFDLEIPDEDAEKLSTVQGAINYLEEQSAAVRG